MSPSSIVHAGVSKRRTARPIWPRWPPRQDFLRDISSACSRPPSASRPSATRWPIASAGWIGSLRVAPSVTDAIYEAGYAASSAAYRDSHQLGMAPRSLKAGGRNERIRHAAARTSLGPILIGATARGICMVEFGGERALLAELRRRFPEASIEPADAALKRWVKRVVAVIDDARPDPALPLDIRGTAFQMRVWQALTKLAARRNDGLLPSWPSASARPPVPVRSREPVPPMASRCWCPVTAWWPATAHSPVTSGASGASAACSSWNRRRTSLGDGPIAFARLAAMDIFRQIGRRRQYTGFGVGTGLRAAVWLLRLSASATKPEAFISSTKARK